MNKELLRLNSVSKSQQGKCILCGISLSVYEKEIHAMIINTDNAKDALIDVLAGAQTADDGEIYIQEEEMPPQETCEKLKSKVVYIRSSDSIVTNLSMAENVFLLNGNRYEKKWLSPRYMRLKALKLFLKMGLELDPKDKVETLSDLHKKFVLIARAVSSGADLIILEGITEEFEKDEVQRIYELLHLLIEAGVSIIYITTQIEEAFKIADRISIIHNASVVNTVYVNDCSKEKRLAMMQGNMVKGPYKENGKIRKHEILRVEKLYTKGIKGVDFSLYEGEVLGISGVSGSRREEIGRTLFGLTKKINGNIYIDGKSVKIKSPRNAVSQSIAYVSGKKLHQRLIPDEDIIHNLSLGMLNKISCFGKINLRVERGICEEWIVQFLKGNKCDSIEDLESIEQYKVLLGRALATKPRILIIGFPVREIDFEVCVQFMDQIKGYCKRGMAVLLLTPETEGAIWYVDRIIDIKRD